MSDIKQLFTRFKGKPVDRLAYEVVPGDVIHSEDVGVYSIQTTQDAFITFNAYEAPKNGDFIIYRNEDDVYHCKRDAFLERNVYPATPGTDFIPASDSASAIEQMMDELKCTGNRISQRGIIERIESVEFNTVQMCDQFFMFCAIRVRGGFVAVGEPSACMDPDNFRVEIGQKISFENTFNKLWSLEAYRVMGNQ